MRGLRILIADDHELLRRGVRSIIEAEAGWTVVGEAGDGLEAFQKAKELKPEIVVLDIGMPRLNGLDAARRIRKVLPSAKILMLTIYDTEELAHAVLEAGARGYVTKSDTGRELVTAIEALRKNKTFFTSRVDQMMLDSFLRGGSTRRTKERSGHELSSREREIVQLIAEGKTNKEVAATLDLSAKTIETHRAHIMKKLSCRTARDLILYAVRNKIVQV
jgi:DNA-binding NarL/FixJ family response regulator